MIDLDRTLVEERTVWRLARHFSKEKEVAAALSSGGEPHATVRESHRVAACFAGVSAREFDEVCGRMVLRPGAAEAAAVLRAWGFRILVATASYEAAARAAVDMLQGDAYAALQAEQVDGVLTGRVADSSWEGPCGLLVCKGRVAASLKRPLVALGDGANDVCMFKEADLAIAMEPCHEDAAAAADVRVPSWDAVPDAVADRLGLPLVKVRRSDEAPNVG